MWDLFSQHKRHKKGFGLPKRICKVPAQTFKHLLKEVLLRSGFVLPFHFYIRFFAWNMLSKSNLASADPFSNDPGNGSRKHWKLKQEEWADELNIDSVPHDPAYDKLFEGRDPGLIKAEMLRVYRMQATRLTLINQERLKFGSMDKTPTARNVPSTGFQFTNFRGRLVKTYNNKCLVLLQRIDRMELERENMFTVLRSGFEVLIAKIGRSQRHEAELRSDQEAREREREFKQQLGLPEGTSWRELSEDKVRVPSAMGQKFVEKLWQVRNARRGGGGGAGNQWDSVSTGRAINAFKPVAQAPDWKEAFYELAAPEEQRSTKSSTKGKRKLQLAHNPNVDRVLDKVLGPVSSASGSKPVSSASGSKPVSSSRGPLPVSSAWFEACFVFAWAVPCFVCTWFVCEWFG
eukprot:g47823.t1